MKIKFIIIIIVIVLIVASGILGSKFSYLRILPKAAGFGKPMTYLILLQNNYEIRATGGYIGSFAIVTINKGRIQELNLFDSNEFDKKSAIKVEPPRPLKEFLHIDNWQFRDSNWSPDFPTSAIMATKFYNLQSGENIDFDGVVAVNANILSTILEVIGPIKIDGSEFNRNNAALALEYEVEQGFYEKGISREQRKEILFRFIKEVIRRAEDLSARDKIGLAKSLKMDLNNKDILVYFSDKRLEKIIKEQGWAGNKKKFIGDYLMVVDSNLGAFKSDLFVNRKLEYTVDLRDPVKPKARLVIIYDHNASEENWLVKDYRDWLRVYTSKEASLSVAEGVKGKTILESDRGHNIFGNFFDVEVGQQKSIVYEYDLPKTVLEDGSYKLLIQKQSGIEKLQVVVTVISPYKVKRLRPNKFGRVVAGKNQAVFRKDIESDEIFEIKFTGVDVGK